MPESGGTQDAPRTAIVIDEANLAMPATAGDGSTGVVLRLLRLRRANGAVLVLGTQEPKDLNKEILSYASHPLTTHTHSAPIYSSNPPISTPTLSLSLPRYVTIRFIGRGIAGEPDRCKPLFAGKRLGLTATAKNQCPPAVGMHQFILDIQVKRSPTFLPLSPSHALHSTHSHAPTTFLPSPQITGEDLGARPKQ